MPASAHPASTSKRMLLHAIGCHCTPLVATGRDSLRHRLIWNHSSLAMAATCRLCPDCMATAMAELHCIRTNNACPRHMMICERIDWLSTTAQHACPSYAAQCIHMRTLIRFDPGMLIGGASLAYNVVSPSLPGFPVAWNSIYFLQEIVCAGALAGWGRPPWGWAGCRVFGVQLFMVLAWRAFFFVLFLGSWGCAALVVGALSGWGVWCFLCLVPVCWLGVSCESRACRTCFWVCKPAGQKVFSDFWACRQQFLKSPLTLKGCLGVHGEGAREGARARSVLQHACSNPLKRVAC